MRVRLLLFTIGWLTLVVPEVLHVYFNMPFPGNQSENTLGVVYFLMRNIYVIRFIGLAIIGYPLYWYLKRGKWYAKVAALGAVFVFICFYVVTNYVLDAYQTFRQPVQKTFVRAEANTIHPANNVIGIVINGEAKAYPIEVLHYLNQVCDTVGGMPVLVTYCTPCCNGRVYSPVVNGAYQPFQLIRMNNAHAMFEDSSTGSWWKQETGEAVAGPLQGEVLNQIPSYQMPLRAWLRKHPNSLIMQRDSTFNNRYDSLDESDKGTREVRLMEKDTQAYFLTSLIVGVIVDSEHTKAYPWSELKRKKVINDTIGGTPIVIMLDTNGASFHAFTASIPESRLYFIYDKDSRVIYDTNTRSIWDNGGACVVGPLEGKRIHVLPAYQESIHLWQQFHPESTVWNVE